MAEIVSDILISPMNASVIRKEMPYWDENTDQQHGKIKGWAKLSLSWYNTHFFLAKEIKVTVT